MQSVVNVVNRQFGPLAVAHKLHGLLNNLVNAVFDILRQ